MTADPIFRIQYENWPDWAMFILEDAGLARDFRVVDLEHGQLEVLLTLGELIQEEKMGLISIRLHGGHVQARHLDPPGEWLHLW